MSGTAMFSRWSAMKDRCENPRTKNFKDYGGRGIKVCERWHSFENWFADMGPLPSPGHSIERRDNNGNYEPTNCYWATRAEQAKNKRNNRWLTANGETLHLSEWARRLGTTTGAILHRLKAGWPVRRALSEPISERPNSKLTPEQAAWIRATYPSKRAPELGRMLGVSAVSVMNIVHGRTFADVRI